MDNQGAVIDRLIDDRGVLSLTANDYAPAIGQLRERWAVKSVYIAGMAGSSRGWLEVPYVDCPAGADRIAGGMIAAPLDGVWLVPGVAQRSQTHVDVMRGEEVQVMGAIAAGLAPADALFCQPGTHNKWIHTRAGRISNFVTVMSGELFSLLQSRGILAGMLDGEVEDTRAFRAGVDRGAGCPSLGAALFEVRASVLLGKIAAADAAAITSGILIGNDLAAAGDIAGQTIHLLGSGNLGDLYRVAIEKSGAEALPIDSDAAFAAGIRILRDRKP